MLVGRPTQNLALKAAIERLQPKDFMGANSRYFECFARMVLEGNDPDLALAANWLHSSPDEYAQLGELTDGAYNCGNIERYADILKEKSALRSLAHIGQTLQATAISANGNGPAVLGQARELICAHLEKGVGEKRILEFKSGTELAAEMPENSEWVMPPYIAAGGITNVGGRVKIGKTEFVMHAVRAILDGAEFLGKATKKHL
jgi:replicative DNA helicase